MQQSKLERVGGFLVILALASVFAWILGRRFPLIEYQPWTAIVIAAIGFAVILVAVQQERATTGRRSGARNDVSNSQVAGSSPPRATTSKPSATDITASPSDEGPA